MEGIKDINFITSRIKEYYCYYYAVLYQNQNYPQGSLDAEAPPRLKFLREIEEPFICVNLCYDCKSHSVNSNVH